MRVRAQCHYDMTVQRQFRILHIEDEPAETVIASDLLARAGVPVELDRVATMAGVRAAVERGGYDLVLSDYALPGLDALEVLKLARERLPDVPFIFLSGTLGEDVAIECLKLGATDYVLKHNLLKLAPAVRRALAEAEEHARRKQAEAALRQSNEAKGRLAAIVENSSDAILSATLDGEITSWNAAAERLFGFSAPEAMGQRITLIVPPDRLSEHALFFERIRSGQSVRTLETVRRSKHGHHIDVQVTLSPVTDEGGRTVGASEIIHDTSHLKSAHEALRESERRLRVFFDSDMFGALHWTADGRITDANDKFLQMLGYTRGDLEGGPLRWVDLTPPEHRQADEHSLAQIRDSGADTPYEKEFICKDGSRLPVIIGAASFEEARQEGVAFVIDNTERKRAETTAAELKRKLDASLLAGEVGLFDWDLVTDRFWGDPNFARFFNVSLDARSTIGIADLMAGIHPDDRALVTERIQRTIQTGAPYEAEYRIIAGSQTRWVVARATAQQDSAGRAVRFPGVLIDITEQQRAQEALRRSEQKFRVIFQQAAVGIGRVRFEDARWIDVNDAFCRMLGYSPEFMRATGWPEITHPDDVNLDLAPFRRMAAGELGSYSVEKRFRHQDGHYVWARLTLSLVRDLEGRPDYEIAIIEDISARKQAEEALKRQTLHLQLLHQASARLLVGHPPVDLLRQIHPQIAEVFGADAFMLYQAEPGNGRLQLLACAGVSEEEKQRLETLRYGRAVCATPDEALHPILATDIQTKEAPNRRFVRKLGFHSYLYYPLILNNHIHGTVAFASHTRAEYDQMDLDFFHTIASTLAEALERERLEKELARHAADLGRMVEDRTAQLRETIGELEGFSYSLVHDMRAPLRAMSCYATVLEEEAGRRLEPTETDLLRKLKASCVRMDQLVTDSLNYSRILHRDLPLGRVNLGELLRGMVETYPNLHEPQADVRIELGDLTVHGNASALTQIFSNLLGNAVKFVAAGVHPRVRVWADPVLSTLSGRPSVRVCLEDNGIGIPETQRERIFGMFERMHREDQYPGTGIGLALVKKSLERTGGRISVESRPERGSRFCVELPLARPADAQSALAA